MVRYKNLCGKPSFLARRQNGGNRERNTFFRIDLRGIAKGKWNVISRKTQMMALFFWKLTAEKGNLLISGIKKTGKSDEQLVIFRKEKRNSFPNTCLTSFTAHYDGLKTGQMQHNRNGSKIRLNPLILWKWNSRKTSSIKSVKTSVTNPKIRWKTKWWLKLKPWLARKQNRKGISKW